MLKKKDRASRSRSMFCRGIRFLGKAGWICLGAGFGCFFLLHGDIVLDSAKKSLHMCANGLIPSLFCFMVLTAWMSSTEISVILSKLLSPVMTWMHLPREAGAAVFMSLLGGYPVGTKLIMDLYQQKRICAADCDLLLTFCCCPAPSFVIITVGCTLLHNRNLGMILYLSELCSMLMLGWIMGLVHMRVHRNCYNQQTKRTESIPAPYGVALVDSVTFASTALIPMCGSVVFFGAIAAIVHQMHFSPVYSSVLCAFLEVTTGCVEIARCAAPLTIMELSFFLAFGGVSILFQRMALLQKTPYCPWHLLAGRFLHGLLSAAFTKLFLYWIPIALPVFGPDAVPSSTYDGNTPFVTICLIGMCSIWLSSLPLPCENK